VGVERDPRGNTIISTESIVDLVIVLQLAYPSEEDDEDTHSIVLGANRKVRARLEALIVWQIRRVPDSEAARVAVIAARDITPGTVEVSVEVQLLARVILVDCSAIPLKVIHAVLDRIDSASHGILGDSYRVSKSPA
jgi:hypothetical protein